MSNTCAMLLENKTVVKLIRSITVSYFLIEYLSEKSFLIFNYNYYISIGNSIEIFTTIELKRYENKILNIK